MKKKLLLFTIMLLQGALLFSQREITSSSIQNIDTIFDYEYAPGQHALNYAKGDDGSDFKGTSASSAYILLGGWGGHVDAGFDHSIYNIGGYDFGVFSQPGSGNEPGIVYVMQDANNNGAPDDTWYELAGSETDSSGYIRGYEVTYYKPGTAKNGNTSVVSWKDNQGNFDTLVYARWWDDTKDSVTFTGTKLPDNKYNVSGSYWNDISGRFTYGYAENYSGDDYKSSGKYNQFDISDAIDSEGNPVELSYIDFIKVQTGCFFEAGWLGEVSTEVSGAIDLTMVNFEPALFEEFNISEDSIWQADASDAELYETLTKTGISGSFSFKSNSTNWGSMTSWYGVSISNQTDNETAGGSDNQYNSAAGGDITGNGNYIVGYDGYSTGMASDAMITFNLIGHPDGEIIEGCYITNNTYATTSLKNGDTFAKKFGGDDGTDPDWFKLIATGIDAVGDTTDTVSFYMADFRFENSDDDYIVEDWQWFDLSSLGEVTEIRFTMASSDAGDYGPNTPLYFCLDNLNYSGFAVNKSLSDIKVNMGSENDSIDLTTFLTYEFGTINYVVSSTDKNTITAPSTLDSLLIIDYADATGSDTLVITGSTTSGHTYSDTIVVTICEAPSYNGTLSDITVDEDAPYDTIIIKGFFDYDDKATVSLTTTETRLTDNINLVDPYIYGDTILVLKYEDNVFGVSKVALTCTVNGDILTDTILLTVNSVDDTVYVKSPLSDFSKKEDYSNNDWYKYINSVFYDGDGDEITKTIECISNPDMMSAEIREGGKYIDFYFEPDSNGTSTFVLTGTTPDGLYATDTFNFTLTSVEDAPYVKTPISVLDNFVGKYDTIDISNLFTDPDKEDDDELIEVSMSSNSASEYIEVTLAGDSIIVYYKAIGTSTLVLEALSDGLTCTEEVTITAYEDLEPVIISEVGNMSEYENSTDSIIVLTDVFENAISYNILISDTAVAESRISNDTLYLSYKASGQTNISVIGENLYRADTISFIIGVYPEISGDYIISNFENLDLDNESFWNGSDGTGKFKTGLTSLDNDYNASWSSWSGWAYSNISDNETSGYANQYSAITGAGFDTTASEGKNYGVAYNPTPMTFTDNTPHLVKGMYLTNSTYATLSMEEGDDYAKKFGGEDGTDPDYLKLNIWGIADGAATDTIEFYLADFRFDDNTKDYIIKTWQWVELSSLGEVDSLLFSMESSDVGDWGINTPLYFNIDNIYVVPDYAPEMVEPIAAISGYENDDDVTIDLDIYFDDLDSDVNITYTYTGSSFDTVATASIEDSLLTIDFLKMGQTNILVTATTNGKSTTEKIVVGVYPEITGNYLVSDFEDLALTNESYWNGSDLTGGFTSGAAQFNNAYNPSWYSWSGWAYSNVSDNETAGYTNQYSAITGAGFDTLASDGKNYGVAYTPDAVKFTDGISHQVKGLYVTNSTYATLSMEQGDDYAKKFGGDDGNDADYFKLNIWGLLNGSATDTIEFYLADFRFDDNTNDYIVKTWQWVDLAELGKIDSLFFGLESSDMGDWGINTPTYFNIDNICIVPDSAPTVANPIADISAKDNADDSVVDISSVFADTDDETITVSVLSNSNTEVAEATISGTNLTIDFVAEGTTTVIIEGSSNNKSAYDTILVTVVADLEPEVANPIADISVIENSADSIISLANVFTDTDDEDDAIAKYVASNSNSDIVTASISGNELTLSFITDATGESEIVIEALSNGKAAYDTILVTVTPTSFEDASIASVIVYPNPSNGIFRIATGNSESSVVKIFDVNGKVAFTDMQYVSDKEINISNLPSGVYSVYIQQGSTLTNKTIVKD